MWTYADAINIVLDLYKAGEIPLDQLDATATELWDWMQAENENPV